MIVQSEWLLFRSNSEILVRCIYTPSLKFLLFLMYMIGVMWNHYALDDGLSRWRDGNGHHCMYRSALQIMEVHFVIFHFGLIFPMHTHGYRSRNHSRETLRQTNTNTIINTKKPSEACLLNVMCHFPLFFQVIEICQNWHIWFHHQSYTSASL